MRYDISSTQVFTPRGKVGVALFMCAPFLCWFAYWSLMSPPRFRTPDAALLHAVVTTGAVGVGILATMAGCVLMLIGRQTIYDVRVYEPVQRRPDPPRETDWGRIKREMG